MIDECKWSFDGIIQTAETVIAWRRISLLSFAHNKAYVTALGMNRRLREEWPATSLGISDTWQKVCRCQVFVTDLTLRLLMSYIYMEHLFLMFLDHTQRRSTVGRTPLDE